jgi:hypothetical protein
MAGRKPGSFQNIGDKMSSLSNGDVRFGTLLTFVGGSMSAYGMMQIDDSMWRGIGTIAIGFIIDGAGLSRVEAGIKEILRVRDLENKNTRR